MRYPVITHSKCAELSAQLIEGREPSIDAHAEWIGIGDDIEFEEIADVAAAITNEARGWTDRDRDRFEGRVSGRLHDALVGVPTEILDDRGFWRYMSLRYFWEFIAWREEGPFSKGNYLKYVDAASNTESVLPRMYLRASAVGGGAHADLTGAIPNSTDFWRSHVLRVRTGSAAPVTRAFASKQAELRLMTDPLRETARRLNRTWTNVVLHLYDDDESGSLMSDLWPDTNG